MRDAFEGLLRMGVAGIIILVAIGTALAPIAVAALPIIVAACVVFTAFIYIAAAVKSFREFNEARNKRLSRDPRRR